MTPNQIALVRSSFALVKPISQEAAGIFYARLFELDPSLRPMFTSDMTEQGRKLMSMLATSVGALDRPDTLLPVVAQLGRKHVGYGVRDEHYATVGQALLDTLATGLGPAFTAETRAAWVAAYGLLSGVMIEASHDGSRP